MQLIRLWLLHKLELQIMVSFLYQRLDLLSVKSLVYKGIMYDNYSVGLSVGSQVIGGKTTYLNPYCNQDGEFNKIDIQVISSNFDNMNFNVQQTIAQAKPVIPFQLTEAYKKAIYTDLVGYDIAKDRLEQISITYQLEMVAGDKVFIGDTFLKNNALLTGKANDMWLYFSPDEFYTNTDTSCKGTRIGSKKPNIGSNFASVPSEVDLTLYSSWAIGDIDGNLYIGVNNNKEVFRDVYFGLLN